jgi:hypothetical protein
MIMTIIFRELYNLNDLKHNHAFVSTYTSVLIIRVVFSLSSLYPSVSITKPVEI